MVSVRVALALLLAVLSAGMATADDTTVALPSGLHELWDGGERCGEPTPEQWALTLGLDYQTAAQIAPDAKVIPYRFIVEDLVAAVQAQADARSRPVPARSPRQPATRNGTVGSSANIFGFTGHEMDPETGLIYMKGRFYDPEVGRFLTEDPFEGSIYEPPSLHRYLYAYANPTVYVDPDGRCVGKLQQTDFCQAIARGLEFLIAGDPIARAEQEIERRDKVVQGRREFRAQVGREPLPDEVVWAEGSRALTSGFEEIDMSGRIEPDHAEWVAVGAGIGTRMAVNSARAAGATTAEQFVAGATQLGDEAVGELVGVSPSDAADLARLARRPWEGTAPARPSSSGPMIVSESPGGGVDLTPFPTTSRPSPPPTRSTSWSRSGTFDETPVRWSATRPRGTGQDYAVYQRVDVDWSRVRTGGDKRFIGKTNAEAARAGLAPQLDDDYFATLHHVGQDSRGPLVEASTRYHGVGRPGQQQLHSQFGANQPNSSYPIDRREFSVDTREYWQWRIGQEDP